MKTLISVLLLLSAPYLFGQTLNDIRSEFSAVVQNPEESRRFYDYLKKIENPPSTVKAYQAVSEALLAQVVWNPFNKLAQVMKYDKQMENAVTEDPDNVEIRFLRLAIEFNLPSFLGMSTHIEEDTQRIIQNMSSINSMQLDKSYGRYIFHFLSQSELCTDEEIYLLQRSLSMSQ
ncbi:hypothetical protein [Ekhidna sp.]|uniref:hypothetical protein n=1 Tax=Ekhidna sp. TaxID=2608089 RepID=UPI0032EB3164